MIRNNGRKLDKFASATVTLQQKSMLLNMKNILQRSDIY